MSFGVGDRVKVYGAALAITPSGRELALLNGEPGVIVEIFDSDLIDFRYHEVSLDAPVLENVALVRVHERQLEHEARRFILTRYPISGTQVTPLSGGLAPGEEIEVVEVRKRK